MKIIKNIPSLPNVEVFANGALLQTFVLHNTSTGHTIIKKDDGNWYEGITDTIQYWGSHIDDAAGFHGRAETLCTTLTTPPVIDDIQVGISCYYDVVEESRVWAGGDYGYAYLPGIGRIVPTDYNSVTVYDPNNKTPVQVTGQAAEIITSLLSLITKQ